jgi:5-methylcytosine-specific restriction enzyme B
MPDVEVLRGAKVGTLALDDFLEELNRRIAKTEGREKQIGHSFLLEDGEPITDADEFARRFRQEILPLLQEYCYDDYTALASYIGSKLVDKNARRSTGNDSQMRMHSWRPLKRSSAAAREASREIHLR